MKCNRIYILCFLMVAMVCAIPNDAAARSKKRRLKKERSPLRL